MPKATIFDVAKQAGVSIKTVSRVVNHEPNVRDSTKERVQQAITKLNYRPDPAARNLASHRTHLIGLVYDDPEAYETPSSGYIIRMQQGTMRACRSAHHELFIHPCNYRNKDVGAELQAVIDQVKPAGIVLAAPLSNMSKIVNAIVSTGTPLVKIAPGTEGGEQYSIATNDREISAEMTRYLASLGHTRIAYIKGHPSHKAVSNRFLGYKDGLKKAGLPFRETLVCEGDNSIGSGEICAEHLLKQKNRPTAIFAANDDMAAGVVRVADRMDIDIPGQLSVAGCDDIALARQIYPALTTIRQPLAAMAERAAMALVESGGKKGREIVPASIEIRESTGPAPSG
jgi:LacI family transcriptional regulator